ncbi:recombinase family protein [Mycobacterium sp. 134]|uniref:recombinase family protein n=1 Tax=Mycobacterium sp. 134 TaxID=3400425 RepID=UPI003AAB42FF
MRKRLGYARVAGRPKALDQQQYDALTEAGVDPDDMYVDELSAASTKDPRPGLSALLNNVGAGDTIVVHSVDRLGRSVAEMLATINDLADRGADLHSVREGIDTRTTAGRMMVGVLVSVAQLGIEQEQERHATPPRKAQGQAGGRPRKLTPEQRQQVLDLAAAQVSAAEIATRFSVGRDTVYRVIRAASSDTANELA